MICLTTSSKRECAISSISTNFSQWQSPPARSFREIHVGERTCATQHPQTCCGATLPTIPQQVWYFSVQCEGARSARPSKARQGPIARYRVQDLGRDSCHALLGPHTVALSANSDTCGDEDMPQAQGGDDASTEPPHSHVCLAEGQSSSARITPDPPRSPGQADSRMLQLLPRIVAWRKDSPVATPSQSTNPRWSPVFALPRLCRRWRRVGTPDCAPWEGRFGKERGCAEPSAA